MRAKTLVKGLFLVTVLVAVFAVFNVMRKGDASLSQHQILIATSALPAGTLLRSQDVQWHAVNATEGDQIVRPSGPAVEAKPELVQEAEARTYGAVLRHPLNAGDPIRRGDIVRPGDRDFLQVVLPPGARAIAIPVATGGASTGLLSPGDRVDVVLTQNFKNEGADTRTPLTRRSVSETIVPNLRVLAIDAPDVKPAASTNGGFGRTVTLEVTPDQVEKMNVAAELGKLTVALRSAQLAASNEPVKPQWAGDVSPALFGAPQEKPVALHPTPIMVLRGGGEKNGGSQESPRREIIKSE